MQRKLRPVLCGTLLVIFACNSGCLSPKRTPTLSSPDATATPEPYKKQANRTGGDDAAAWLAGTLRSEDGTVRKTGLREARAHRNALLNYQSSFDSFLSGGLGPWTSRGPTNVGGRTRSLIIHPTQPNTMWAGAVSGGVWKTNDSGANWFPLDDSMENLAVVSLAIDPNDSNTLYAGTGEGFASGYFEPRGEGIFKTTDGGSTWTQLASTTSWTMVHDIIIHPSGNVFAAVSDPGQGVMRSTDGGLTWTNLLQTTSAFHLEIDPNNSDRIAFSGSKIVAPFGPVTSIWISNDAGSTWTRTSHPPVFVGGYRFEIAWAPSAPGRLYMQDVISFLPDGGLYRSDDGGVTFSLVNTANFDWSNYHQTLWVHPNNADFIITGGVDLWRSLDGGITFEKISDWSQDTISAHADHHAIVPHPDFDGVTNKIIYNASDGGIARADNIETVTTTSGWTILENDYVTTQFYGADGLGWNGRVYGGTQDNGSLYAPNTTTDYVEPYGGDGGPTRFDTANENICYGQMQYLGLHRSTDGCQSSVRIDSGLDKTDVNFIAPIELDPEDPAILYAASGILHRTMNAREEPEPTWDQIRPYNTDSISAIAVTQADSNIVWVGQNDGVIEITNNARDALPTWTIIDDNNTTDPLPNRWVLRILIDPDDPNRVYVGLGGYEPDNLWTSADGGASWSTLVGSGATALPPAPVRGIARHPCNANWLYVGTDVGVFVSEDGGSTWSTSNEGPASVSVHELRFMAESGRLLAATYGRGLWEATASSGSPDLDGDGLDDSCDLDDDGDRVEDTMDCAPTDPNLSAVPQAVEGVLLSQSTGTVLQWDNQDETATWEVVGQTIQQLRTDDGVAIVDCLADGLTTNQWEDLRPDPNVGDGYYYLIRGQNGCGDGTLGDDSNGTPRSPTGLCP